MFICAQTALSLFTHTYMKFLSFLTQRQFLLNKCRQSASLFKFKGNKLTSAYKILPMDAVWSWESFIYEEWKDTFEENKQGFDGKSPTLTHFIAFEEHMADKCSQNRREV